MIFGEKIKLIVYVNEHDFVSDIHIPSRSCLLLCFLYELLMGFTIQENKTTLYTTSI
jgi:hypothetical protein